MLKILREEIETDGCQELNKSLFFSSLYFDVNGTRQQKNRNNLLEKKIRRPENDIQIEPPPQKKKNRRRFRGQWETGRPRRPPKQSLLLLRVDSGLRVRQRPSRWIGGIQRSPKETAKFKWIVRVQCHCWGSNLPNRILLPVSRLGCSAPEGLSRKPDFLIDVDQKKYTNRYNFWSHDW